MRGCRSTRSSAEFVVGAVSTDVQSGQAMVCYLPGIETAERECWVHQQGRRGQGVLHHPGDGRRRALSSRTLRTNREAGTISRSCRLRAADRAIEIEVCGGWRAPNRLIEHTSNIKSP